jgi:hypothetical protein
VTGVQTCALPIFSNPIVWKAQLSLSFAIIICLAFIVF